MSFRDNQDLRPREAGGWAYAEHELWSVFAPLIGPEGVSVYMAMCRLVPLAAINADRQVSVRRVSELSCVSRSKCAETIKDILKLGMISETRYLDGRDPTYKLISLRDLAKQGEVELKRRIGVRAEDTAPYDQVAKHNRERALRAEKRRLAALSTASDQDLPLLDGVSGGTSDPHGVRTADTEAKLVEAGDEPTSVSAENVTVSAKPVSVSAESVTVSATRGPLLEGKGNEVKNKNPLPPAEQGESDGEDGDPFPLLPTERCAFGDPGFALAVPIAASWVMAQLGISKRRLQPVIAKQLELRCRQQRRESLQDAAALMAKQGKVMHRDRELLRHAPWGWMRWIEEGHWQRPLPYDQAKVQAATAKTDERVADDLQAQQAERHAKTRAYILGNAAAVAGVPGLAPIAAELERVAAMVETLGLKELDQELARLEERMLADALAGCDADEQAKLEAAVDADLKKRHVTWSAVHTAEIRKQIRERLLQEQSGLPKLQLFYMPRG